MTAQPAFQGPAQAGQLLPLGNFQRGDGQNFAYGSLGGRYTLVCFYGSASTSFGQKALVALETIRPLIDPEHRVVLAVSANPSDRQHPAVLKLPPHFLPLWDPDARMASAWGLTTPEKQVRLGWLLVDPCMRLIGRWHLEDAESALAAFAALPPAADYAGVLLHAPVLIVPRLFEPEFCRTLIAQYEKQGGAESGVTREIDGKTRVVRDDSFKRRADCIIEDEALRTAARDRLLVRLLPMLKKAFQYQATRMERYIIACYDAESQGGGFFKAHRDDTTRGTAHRRFAVTINLNAEDYEGGDLRFPEFGLQTYRAPTGGAVVFSCSLLHEATPMIRGKRYAFLPFLYDEEAAQVRAANNTFLDESVGHYRNVITHPAVEESQEQTRI